MAGERARAHALQSVGSAASLPVSGSAPSGGAGPLSAAELAALERGATHLRALRRAAWVARLNGSGLLFCGVLCLPFGFFDASTWLIGFVAAALGAIELWGGRAWQNADVRAPTVLLANQAALFVAIAIYCVVSVISALSGPSPSELLAGQQSDMLDMLGASDLTDGMDDVSGMLDGAYRMVAIGFYGAVLAASALHQGLCAAYYARTRQSLQAFREQTPGWVRTVLARVSA